ncbi:hypothetical protein CANINC_002386 [Pichia inconspicua]|uniref:Ketoreductase (KR) domain-containing protein n=1 Tax=Pichia inconspicua TaxID=52247 RepID=A0A4T0X1S0_9ASCO|nr:hypothetical protein CANINC_002386 [[Candida] inconspicua]
MPLDILKYGFIEGFDNIPYWNQIKTYAPYLVGATLLKLYTNGSSNTWERKLHGKVYIVTGGTSGIGAAVVRDLATRGAQIVLLTSQLSEESDASAKSWISEYVDDLRETTNNQLIYAEDCDLSSLYSIRKFATKWLDNSPARRLDGVICLAAECLPVNKVRQNSVDGIEIQMAINYLGHYHLLTLLEPALRVQPPDRDVRVLVASCLSQSLGSVEINDLLWEERAYPYNKPWKVFGTSKLMLNLFAKEFQRKVENTPRADKQPCAIRVNIVNPGIVRSPSTRRFFSAGSIIGLLIYVILYPIIWLLVKSCEQGAESFIFAINSPNLHTINGGNYIKECDILPNESRPELRDKNLQQEIFNITAKKIEVLEKMSAVRRNKNKKKKKKNVKSESTKAPVASPVNGSSIPKKNVKENELFASAFQEEPSLYPDLSKFGKNIPDDIEAGREARLRRLDAKYEQSRQRRAKAVTETASSVELDTPLKPASSNSQSNDDPPKKTQTKISKTRKA